MSRLKILGGFLLTIILAGCLVIFFHSTIINGPNEHLMSGSGDGFKNYATLVYHLKHGTSSSHFEGMNYPFGEQVVFTDNQPLFANKLRVLSKFVPGISDWGVGWMHLALFAGIALAAGFIYLILERLKIPMWYAVPAALFIAFLSPQMLRFGGHYALGHCWVIPLMLYLLLRYQKKRLWIWALLIGVSTTIGSGLHMYFFALNSFFVTLWLFFDLLRFPKKKRLFQNALSFALMAILPFALITIWMGLTDGITDRPSSPYGFLVYRSVPEAIFLPIGLPLGEWINENIHQIRTIPWEGRAHVGMVASVFSLYLFVFMVIRVVRFKFTISLLPQRSPFLLNCLAAASALLLFSWGIPFIWNLEWLLDYSGPLQQFRGIGRFAWLFYYVINILAFFSIYHFFKKLPVVFFAAMIATTLLSSAFQVYQYQSQYLYATDEWNSTAELMKYRSDHWKHVLDKEKYQAIIPLPYFHVGSENFYLEPAGYPLKEVLSASILSGIPTTGVFMSRTSLSQTMENIQLLSEPYREFSVLEKMDAQKPFAIWHKEGNPLPAHQQNLLNRSKKIWSKEKNTIYEISPQEIKNLIEEKRSRIINDYQTDSLFINPNNSSLESTDSLHRYFTDFSGEQIFTAKTGRDFYRKIEMPSKKPGMYIYSVWVKLKEDLAPRSEILIHETIDGKPIAFKDHAIGKSTVVIDGEWGLIEMPFEVKQEQSALEITIFMNGFIKPTLTFRDLLIRPADESVYSKTDEGLMKNLRWYK